MQLIVQPYFVLSILCLQNTPAESLLAAGGGFRIEHIQYSIISITEKRESAEGACQEACPSFNRTKKLAKTQHLVNIPKSQLCTVKPCIQMFLYCEGGG